MQYNEAQQSFKQRLPELSSADVSAPNLSKKVSESATQVLRGDEVLATFPGTPRDPQGQARANAFLKAISGYFLRRRETGELLGEVDPECQYRRTTVLENEKIGLFVATWGRKVPIPGLVQRLGDEGFFVTRAYAGKRKGSAWVPNLQSAVYPGRLALIDNEMDVQAADDRHDRVVEMLSEKILLGDVDLIEVGSPMQKAA